MRKYASVGIAYVSVYIASGGGDERKERKEEKKNGTADNKGSYIRSSAVMVTDAASVMPEVP